MEDQSRRRPEARSIWLALAATAAGLAACGGAEEDEVRPGFWFDERAPLTAADLGALGYAEGYEPPDTTWTGLRIHDPERAYLGPLAFSSGHEPAAYVLSSDGEIERRWALETAPNVADLGPDVQHPTQRAWRRIEPLPDGGLLAIHEGLCLLGLDADSKIVWRGVPGAHHDLAVDGSSAWVLDRVVGDVLDGRAGADGARVVLDGLVRVSLADGGEEDRLSLPDLLAASQWSGVYEQAVAQARRIDVGERDARGRTRTALDPLHANALLAVPGAPDELVVFLRDVGAFMGINVRSRTLDWFQIGPWQGAHDPQFDPRVDGRILLFDNFGAADPSAPASRIVAIDRATFETETVFEDSPPTRFHSPVCGAILPLPGGLLLAVETTAGRAVQIDRDGKIVWEFRTPFRIEAEGLVAALLDMRPL